MGPHLINTHDSTSIAEYKGPHYIIYNNTANCIKGIDQPYSRRVIDNNAKDERLNDWEHREIPRNTTKIPVTLKTVGGWHYIYYYSHNIKQRAKTIRCPPYVFKVPVTETFELEGQKHTPQHQAH